MTQAQLLADFDRAFAPVESLVEGIRDDQWASGTPCDDWDVRALLNHIQIGNLQFTALVRSERRPDRNADHLGDEPAKAFREAGADLRDAFAAPGVLERAYQSPLGPANGALLVHMRINELLVHGWDLARATDQAADLPEDLASQTLVMWRQRMTSKPRGGPFGPEQPVAAEAPVIDQLAAFLGRQP